MSPSPPESGLAGAQRALGSVSGRMLLVVGLACLMLFVAATAQVRGSVNQAARARELAEQSERLDGLLTLRSALAQEQMITTLDHLELLEEIEPLTQTGVTLESVRARTDEATKVHHLTQLETINLQLARHSGGFSRDEYLNLRLFRNLSATVSLNIDRLVAEMRISLIELGDPRVGQALDRLTTLDDLDQYAGQTVVDLVDLWFASPSDTNQRAARLDASMTGLDRARNAAGGRISNAAIESAPDGWDLSAPEFDNVVQRAFLGQRISPGSAASPSVLAGLFQGVERASATTTVVSAQIELDLAAVSQALRSAMERAILVAFGLPMMVVMLVMLALRNARAVVDPLRQLGSAALRLQYGETDHLGLEEVRGPQEVESAAKALAAAAQSLQILKRKAALIARGDIGGPELEQPVPGELGRVFDEAVSTFTTTVTERMQLAHRMEYRSRHDHLTDVLSRGAALEMLERTLADRDTPLAVAHVDLEQFRELNRVFGIATGDRVLVEVGEILRAATRTVGGVGRLGADEFLVILIGEEATATVHERMAAVIDEIEHQVGYADRITSVRARVGVAIRTLHRDESAGDLIRMAVHASEQARDQALGSVVTFDDASRAQVQADSDLEVALRQAVHTGEGLHLWFQPLVSAKTGAPTGVEALIRWDRPGYGRVPPDRLIAIAERSDLIVDLDSWVMDRAMGQLCEWNDHPVLSSLTMSINVSGRHVAKRSLVTTVQSRLQHHAVLPSQVMLELTETSLATDLHGVSERLGRLREMGVRVAVDDFGTGYTGLGQLRTLPIDELKLDRSLVHGVSENPEAWRLLSLVCGLGRFLDVEIVAEGVESAEEAAMLRELDVDLLQGYYFSPALPADQASQWLLTRLSQSSGTRTTS